MNRILLILFIVCIAYSSNDRYINNVKFDGNESIASKELETVMKSISRQLFQKTIYNSKLVKVDELALKTYYISKGFLEVNVETVTEMFSSNTFNLTFHINEGVCFKLREINIVGNKLFSDSEILSIINLKPKEFYNPVLLREQLIELKEKFGGDSSPPRCSI